jgi:RNA polymerase sigma-70 factor, ECF subfamily
LAAGASKSMTAAGGVDGRRGFRANTRRLSRRRVTRGDASRKLGGLCGLMRRNNQRLYRLARGFLRDDLEAEEAVHDGYVSAFTHLDGCRGGSSLATWLARIVSNEALARLRRRRSTVDISEMAETLAAYEGPLTTAQPTPEQAIARREIRNAIEKAVDELPPNFRSVFVLRTIEQMSVEETSAYLCIPSETVKTRLHRANKLLRRALTMQFGAIFDDMYSFLGARCDRLVATVLQRIGLSAETRFTVPQSDRPAPCRSPP